MTIKIDITKALLIFLCIVFTLIPCIVYGAAIVKSIHMSADCIEYLKLAADANDIKLAERHLTVAVEYLEENDLTEGSTKIIFYKPTDDLGLWYENLKSAQKQLKELKSRDDLTDLEESNALMKLRETLLDEEGSVTHPRMISFYPDHVAWFWWMALICFMVFGVIVFGVGSLCLT